MLYKKFTIVNRWINSGLVAQVVRHSPPTAALGSRIRVSVTPCGFRGGRIGVWVGFSRGFSRFPLPQISFHHFSPLISSISFHFICPLMVHQAWSAGTLAILGPTISGFHRISSLDPTLCWIRVDIYFFNSGLVNLMV